MTQQSSTTDTTSSARSAPVTLQYQVQDDCDSPIVCKDYELLVVACEPRNLYDICDYTAAEIDVFSRLQNFTFHTTLLKVKVAQPQKHAVIFAPTPLAKMNGSVYGFRNESAKQFGLEAANSMDHNLITVYQWQGVQTPPWPASKFELLFKQQLDELAWWPFGNDYEVLNTLTTPYFDHFSDDDLKNGLPWKFLDIQGENNTLYVHASTCFESALHCWDYGAMLVNSVHKARLALPQALDAPIVIIGAGVSGLLFAVRLKRLGYTNIEILESTNRFGGKTHTIVKDGPYPPGKTDKTVCELGTCYLSPAYAPMTKSLAEFLDGNSQIDFTRAQDNFRGIVTEGQFPPGVDLELVINYSEYIILKAEAEEGLSEDDKRLIAMELASDLARYTFIHWEVMGEQRPMPLTPPTDFLEEHGSKTLFEFLEHHQLKALTGLLQYAYEVQGYGDLESISAYYGLVWITPIVTITILLNSLKLENKPVVTSWTQGWGDLWTQIAEKENLNITYQAKATSIQRHC